jgi:hypothetical protein
MRKSRLIPPHVTGNDILVYQIIIRKQHQGIKQGGFESCSVEHKLRIRAILIAVGFASVNKKTAPCLDLQRGGLEILEKRARWESTAGRPAQAGRIVSYLLRRPSAVS